MSQDETNALQELPQDRSITFAPQSLSEALAVSEVLAKSTIVPKDYIGKPANILVAFQVAHELGIGVMQAMQGIAVINGRPTIYGDLMLALCKSHPQWEDMIEECDGEVATCTVMRKGARPVTRTFSMDDAAKAGLTGKSGPWSQYPKRMLAMRARSFALRDAFADALKGLDSSEVAMDTPVEKDITPPPEPASRSAAVKARLQSKRGEEDGAEGEKKEAKAGSAGKPKERNAHSADAIEAEMNAARSEDELRAITERESFKRLGPKDKVRLRTVYAERLSIIRKAESNGGND